MIEKIDLIRGVGKFKECAPKNITLTDKVLVYGRNTRGKSTFTSILNSLKKNKPNLIIGRKTFGFNSSQEIFLKLNTVLEVEKQ